MNAKTNTTVGAGCLLLFSLPFAAVGVGALGMVVWTMGTWLSMQSWQEVPAYIDWVNLVSSDSKKNTTHHVEAQYSYRWEGVRHEGDRVSQYSADDNVGSFHQRVAAELSEHRDKRIPFRCYVNPKNPDQVVLYRNLRVEMLGFMLLFSLLFGGAGFGLMGAALYGNRVLREQQALQEQYPVEPWRWRKDWEKGVISANTKGKMVAAIIFATFWNMISAPLLFVVPNEVRDGNHLALIGLLFPLVGAILLGVAVYKVLQWRRYGATVFEMASVPGVVGGLLQGRVRIPTMVQPEEDASITLSCVNRRTTGSGKNSHTSNVILWQTEATLPRNGLMLDGRETEIPVSFGIPTDRSSTDDSDSNNQILWQLGVKIATQGVDFLAEFEVPVFRTAGSATAGPGRMPGDGPLVIALDEAGNPIPDGNTPDPAKTEESLRSAGILAEPCVGGGITLLFPMLRLPGMAIGALLFTVVWGGSLAWMLHGQGPLFPQVVSGLFLLLMVYITLDLCTGKSRIEVSRTGILVRGGFFGLGPVRRLSFAELGGLDLKSTLQVGNRLYFAVDIKKLGGGTLRVANRLRQEEANAVVRTIETAIAACR